MSYAAPGSLASAFDTVCVGDDGVLAANCDAKSWAYSRRALAAAGVTQGQPMDVPGTALHFTLPAIQPGQRGNATGNGRTITLNLPADATRISFIGAGTQGNQNTNGTATFSDGPPPPSRSARRLDTGWQRERHSVVRERRGGEGRRACSAPTGTARSRSCSRPRPTRSRSARRWCR